MLVGASATVKVALLVAVSPPTVTVILELVAPVGTSTMSLVVVALLTLAVTSPNFTVLLAGVSSKLVPFMVTSVPTGPEGGVKLVMVGASPVLGVSGPSSLPQESTNKHTDRISAAHVLNFFITITFKVTNSNKVRANGCVLGVPIDGCPV